MKETNPDNRPPSCRRSGAVPAPSDFICTRPMFESDVVFRSWKIELTNSRILKASTFKSGVELKSQAQRIWDCIYDFNHFFPKAFPQIYKNVEVLEGDGKSVGSIRLINYAEGNPMTAVTEKLRVVDEEKKTLGYEIIEGDILKLYKNFKGTVVVSSKEDGSLVSFSAELEKANEDVPNPDPLMDFVVKVFLDLDAYLLKQ